MSAYDSPISVAPDELAALDTVAAFLEQCPYAPGCPATEIGRRLQLDAPRTRHLLAQLVEFALLEHVRERAGSLEHWGGPDVRPTGDGWAVLDAADGCRGVPS